MKTAIKTFALALATVFTSFAQDSTTVDLKFGPDKTKTEENMSLYMEPYKRKNYKDAFPFWSYVFHHAPKRTKNLYIHGPKMIKSFMKNDPTNATAWVDSLFMVYDQYSEYYPEKKGANIGKKGVDLFVFYGKEITDDQLIKVNKLLKEAYDFSGNEISGAVINAYFITSAKLVIKELNTKDQLLEMYANLGNVIEYQKAKYNQVKFNLEEKKEQGTELSKKEAKSLKRTVSALKKLGKVEANMEKTLAPHATCEKLDQIYTAQFEENKENEKWLTRAAKLLKKKECTDSDIFFKIADQLYKLHPAAGPAANLAYLSLKQKDYAKASKYINMAIEQEENEITKADYLLLKSKIQLTRGSYQGAAATARKAAALRKGWGEPYLIIANAYGATSRKCGELKSEFEKRVGYIAAIDKASYAKRIDPSVTSKAQRIINSFSPHIPSRTQAFEKGKNPGDKYKINCWYSETITIRVK
jgi:tetratricopeptide (TPR) repeat protein